MPSIKRNLISGTLDMLILRTLAGGPLHGYAIAKAIQEASSAILQIEQGSLYPPRDSHCAIGQARREGSLNGPDTENRRVRGLD